MAHAEAQRRRAEFELCAFASSREILDALEQRHRRQKHLQVGKRTAQKGLRFFIATFRHQTHEKRKRTTSWLWQLLDRDCKLRRFGRRLLMEE